MALPTQVEILSSETVWEHLADSDRSRSLDNEVFGQQGGDIIDLVATGATWPERRYRVRLRSIRSELFPAVGGCFSGVAGQGEKIFPLFASTVIRFVLPRAPIGIYAIELTAYAPNVGDEDLFLTIPTWIRLAPSPTSLEVNRYRTFFNPEVYSKRGPLT